MSADQRLMSVGEVAYELGVSNDTIKRWIKAGTMEGIRLPSGHWRVTVAEVNSFRTRKA